MNKRGSWIGLNCSQRALSVCLARRRRPLKRLFYFPLPGRPMKRVYLEQTQKYPHDLAGNYLDLAIWF